MIFYVRKSTTIFCIRKTTTIPFLEFQQKSRVQLPHSLSASWMNEYGTPEISHTQQQYGTEGVKGRPQLLPPIPCSNIVLRELREAINWSLIFPGGVSFSAMTNDIFPIDFLPIRIPFVSKSIGKV